MFCNEILQRVDFFKLGCIKWNLKTSNRWLCAKRNKRKTNLRHIASYFTARYSE